MDENDIKNEELNSVSEDTTSTVEPVSAPVSAPEPVSEPVSEPVVEAQPIVEEVKSEPIISAPAVNSTGSENNTSSSEKLPGEKNADIALIVSIISAACILCFVTSGLGVIGGIIGLVFSSKSKSEGYEGNKRTAAFIISLICVILGGLTFVACIGCAINCGCNGGLVSW